MNISGINRLYYYNKFGKRILLLGELHLNNGCQSTDENVVDVSDYIIGLVDTIPEDECLDVFLEGTYKKNSVITSFSSLGRTTSALRTKSAFDETKNLRVHYSDPRYIEQDGFIYVYPFTSALSSLKRAGMLKQFQQLVSKDDMLNAIDYLLTIKQVKNRKYFLKIFKVFQELGMIDQDLVDSISPWEEIYFKVVNKELSKLDKSTISKKLLISNLSNAYRHMAETLLETGDPYWEIFGLLTLIPIDIYNLSRMFVLFDDKPNDICNKPTVDNIIIFTGSVHISVYEYFLNISFEMKPEIFSSNESKHNLCLPVVNFDFWE